MNAEILAGVSALGVCADCTVQRRRGASEGDGHGRGARRDESGYMRLWARGRVKVFFGARSAGSSTVGRREGAASGLPSQAGCKGDEGRA